MRIDIMTLFTDMCDSVLGESIIGRARQAGKVEINKVDIRDFSVDERRHVDEKPYGGGDGRIVPLIIIDMLTISLTAAATV